ncbi:MAG: Nif3-like dinuclear metal center hexameric protein [Actinomycetota bacterium]
MILRELEDRLDKLFLKSRAMSWDNAGLQLGRLERDIKKIHITLDISGDVVDKAIADGTDLIISHHPLIFNLLKKITSGNWKEKLVLSLAENNIAVYAAHTNYDICPEGLGDFFIRTLGLKSVSFIQPYSEQWYKFVIFVPPEAEEKVRHAICSRGGGKWKNYSCCTFNTQGVGTFFPEKGSAPYSGEVGKLSFAKEVRIECIVSQSILDEVVNEARRIHPYQEAAYDVYRLENRFEEGGIGVTGSLQEPAGLEEFLKIAKDSAGLPGLRWSGAIGEGKGIEKIAVVWGSANSLNEELAGLDCDLVMVGEINYHNAQDLTEQGKILVEIGHGLSERWAIEGIHDRLKAYLKKEGIKISLTKNNNGYSLWRYYIG